MVQEVQTGVGVYNETTLETIEAIGTSSFKIIEGRQTKGGHYSNRCEATGNVEWNYSSGGSRNSGELESEDTTITSSTGKQGFELVDGGVRVPSAGTYQITLTWGGGGGSYNATMILRGGPNIIYTKEFTSSQTETVTINADLGKFDIIKICGSFYYSGSSTSVYLSFSTKPKLIIQQL